MDSVKDYIDIVSSDLYQKARKVMLSCKKLNQFEISNEYIELSKKKYIKNFTKTKKSINIEDIDSIFNLLKYDKNYLI